MAGAAHKAAILIAGPTASGKSALGLAVAQAFGGTIINADSMQVYDALPIVTARPGAAEMGLVPHRLFGIWAPHEPGSVGRWRKAALDALAETWSLGRLPILVGGTGLYFRALLEGLAPIPDTPADIRAEALALFERLGPDAFHQEVARIDPPLGERLKPADRQRLTRAWEVWRATGRPLSDWQAEPGAEGLAARILTLIIDPPRNELYEAIDARARAMLAQGALEEVRDLLALGLSPSLPVMKAVGVRELGAVVAGEASRDEGVSAMAQASRRYAKRQVTWFRHQLQSNFLLQKSISTKDSGYIEDEIFPLIRYFLLTGG